MKKNNLVCPFCNETIHKDNINRLEIHNIAKIFKELLEVYEKVLNKKYGKQI